jgi:hypothetical protein
MAKSDEEQESDDDENGEDDDDEKHEDEDDGTRRVRHVRSASNSAKSQGERAQTASSGHKRQAGHEPNHQRPKRAKQLKPFRDGIYYGYVAESEPRRQQGRETHERYPFWKTQRGSTNVNHHRTNRHTGDGGRHF